MAQVLDKPTAADVLCPPHMRPLTREEFEKAGQAGIFGPEERLELIGGEVVKKVSPQHNPHATSVVLSAEALRRAFGEAFHVRVQVPMALGPHSEPEPDVYVVPGSPRDYEDEHPRTAVLVVEVADTSLAFDRRVKASLYASAGIPEYWLLNLSARVLEVHRDPGPMADEPFAHHYRSITRHPGNESVAPLAASAAAIRVADLLPTARP